MKLTDLNPQWVVIAPDPRRIGIYFRCPCGCGSVHTVAFEVPIEGGPPNTVYAARWKREGDTFETLTLVPSVLCLPAKHRECKGWHGFIRQGVMEGC